MRRRRVTATLIVGLVFASLGSTCVVQAVTEKPTPHHDMAGPEGIAFITLPLGIVLVVVALPLILVGVLRSKRD